MKDPLCPLTWVNQNNSNHKTESEPTRAGSFWKMWSLGKETLTFYNYRIWKKEKEAFPLSVPPSKTEVKTSQ